MADYTSYGHSTWRWETFVQMDYVERNLWNGLYTTSEAKRFPPGLWHGDHAAMARAAMMPVSDVFDALDRLEAKGIVEIDRRHWVVRMTDLPNAGERPASWKALLGFWNRFVLIPPCPVRDRYPLLLKWLIEQVPKPKGKSKGDRDGSVSTDMLDTWRDTFGSIRVPSEASSSYVLCDSNTSTRHQPSLFGNERATPLLLPSGISKEISPVRPIPNRLGMEKEKEKEKGEVLEQEKEEEEEARREIGRLALKLGATAPEACTVLDLPDPDPEDERSAAGQTNGRPRLHVIAGGVLQDSATAEQAEQASERSRTLREEIARIAGSNPALKTDLKFLADGPVLVSVDPNTRGN